MTNTNIGQDPRPANKNEPAELSEQDLAAVTGGGGGTTTAGPGPTFLAFTFKLVAVKTISWAHDDE
jgi:hypothetical protein